MTTLRDFSLGFQNGGLGAGAGQQFGGLFDPLASLHSERSFTPVNQFPISAPDPKPKMGGLIGFLNGNQPKGRGGIGGLFDVFEEASQSPLFGLGIGLLSGNPQAGFENARGLSQARRQQAEEADDLRRQQMQQATDNAFRTQEIGLAAEKLRQRPGVDLSFLDDGQLDSLIGSFNRR